MPPELKAARSERGGCGGPGPCRAVPGSPPAGRCSGPAARGRLPPGEGREVRGGGGGELASLVAVASPSPSRTHTHTGRRRRRSRRRRSEEHGAPPRGGPGRLGPAGRRPRSPPRAPAASQGVGWGRAPAPAPLPRSAGPGGCLAPSLPPSLAACRALPAPELASAIYYYYFFFPPEAARRPPGGCRGSPAAFWAALGGIPAGLSPPALGTGCWVGTANERGFSNKQRRPC